MQPFFRPGKVTCPIYSRTRDSAVDYGVRGREFIERLWEECAPFVDANARHHAMQDLPAVFWELYLAHALRRSGITLVRQQRTKKKQQGPDLRAENPTVWIEAVTPNPGTGKDALQPPPPGEVHHVPIAPFVLRLRTVIEKKAGIISGYIEDGIIKQGQATVIAVSGMLLHTRWSEQPIPRIVRATLAVGNLVVELDRRTRATTGHSLQYHDEITNAKGAPIRTDIFLNPAYAHISAVLYSPADWMNLPYEPGTECVIVHNHQATTPLPRGWLPVGDEYWWEENAIRSDRHSPRD